MSILYCQKCNKLTIASLSTVRLLSTRQYCTILRISPTLHYFKSYAPMEYKFIITDVPKKVSNNIQNNTKKYSDYNSIRQFCFNCYENMDSYIGGMDFFYNKIDNQIKRYNDFLSKHFTHTKYLKQSIKKIDNALINGFDSEVSMTYTRIKTIYENKLYINLAELSLGELLEIDEFKKYFLTTKK